MSGRVGGKQRVAKRQHTGRDVSATSAMKGSAAFLNPAVPNRLAGPWLALQGESWTTSASRRQVEVFLSQTRSRGDILVPRGHVTQWTCLSMYSCCISPSLDTRCRSKSNEDSVLLRLQMCGHAQRFRVYQPVLLLHREAKKTSQTRDR